MNGNAIAQQWTKSYPGDNRLISPKSSSTRRLAPRCQLIAHPGAEVRPKGLGCSLAVKRYEAGFRTSWGSSVLSYVTRRRIFEESAPSTRGPGWTNRWCNSCSTKEQLCKFGSDKRFESIQVWSQLQDKISHTVKVVRFHELHCEKFDGLGV